MREGTRGRQVRKEAAVTIEKLRHSVVICSHRSCSERPSSGTQTFVVAAAAATAASDSHHQQILHTAAQLLRPGRGRGGSGLQLALARGEDLHDVFVLVLGICVGDALVDDLEQLLVFEGCGDALLVAQLLVHLSAKMGEEEKRNERDCLDGAAGDCDTRKFAQDNGKNCQ